MPENRLMTIAEATDLIRAGLFLMVAADEALLRRLPAGNWIGGTIPYFMGNDGGVATRDKLFVTEIPTDAGLPDMMSFVL